MTKKTKKTKMKIWHVSQDDNSNYGTYSDFVCVAPDEESARRIFPGHDGIDPDWKWNEDGSQQLFKSHTGEWIVPEYVYGGTWTGKTLSAVKVQLIGDAAPNELVTRIVCASFHAG